MLMLTHSWVLLHYLGDQCLDDAYRDLFVYNVCPDLLPIQETLTSSQTHRPSRFVHPPDAFRKAAFIQFHLLVDDVAHHGQIPATPVTVFNADSDGYTYVAGRPLMAPLTELHRSLGKPLTHEAAAYESHMVMEMAFDQRLCQSNHEESVFLVRHLHDALQATKNGGLDEFAATAGWFFGIDADVARDGLCRAADSYTMPRLERFMTLEGRVEGFARKYGLVNPDKQTRTILEDLMLEGMRIAGDCNDFLATVLEAIRQTGFDPDWR